MLHTVWNILLTGLCLGWYMIVLILLCLTSRKRALSFDLVVKCVRDIFEIWDCDIESVIFKLKQFNDR